VRKASDIGIIDGFPHIRLLDKVKNQGKKNESLDSRREKARQNCKTNDKGHAEFGAFIT
jgi:hypothetical protein